jgi:hypothetical protein
MVGRKTSFCGLVWTGVEGHAIRCEHGTVCLYHRLGKAGAAGCSRDQVSGGGHW